MGRPNSTSWIPIFPLPNVVFFPKTMLPLHIFEMRYRAMVADALGGDKLLGMVLLKEGWERDYYGNPEVYEIGCVGEVERVEKLKDGKYNLLLRGISKVRIEKLIENRPYRIGEVRLLEDIVALDAKEKKAQLVDLYKNFIKEVSEQEISGLDALSFLSYEALVNNIASVLSVSVYQKQELLELNRVEQRYDHVTNILRKQMETLSLHKRFPHLVPEETGQN